MSWLTRRVIVQWSMRGLLRCHKAWALYALQRRLRRQIGGIDKDKRHARPEIRVNRAKSMIRLG